MMLDRRAALLTGAGGGIGRAIALAFARHGAHVIAVDLDKATAEETAALVEGAGGAATAFGADIADPQICGELREAVVDRGIVVSDVVNCAGVIRRGKVDDFAAVDDWSQTLAVDLSAPFLVTRTFVPDLEATEGSVVSVGSIQSFVHTPNSVAYTAAKHGLLGLTKALAVELGPRGIRVNGVAPGLVITDFNRRDLALNPERRKGFVARTPLQALASPEAVADATVFLASEMARGVTGAMLPVDGGYLCH